MRDFYDIWLENHDPEYFEYQTKLRAYSKSVGVQNAPVVSPPVSEDEEEVEDDFEDIA